MTEELTKTEARQGDRRRMNMTCFCVGIAARVHPARHSLPDLGLTKSRSQDDSGSQRAGCADRAARARLFGLSCLEEGPRPTARGKGA